MRVSRSTHENYVNAKLIQKLVTIQSTVLIHFSRKKCVTVTSILEKNILSEIAYEYKH